MTHQIVLIIHLLAATVWVGGHLILLLIYVPKAKKSNSLDGISFFRKNFENIGIPALILLLITGVLLAYDYDVSIDKWFQFKGGIERIVSIKLLLFISTLILAISATKFIFPRLKNQPKPILYVFIILVTSIAVIMLVLGSLIRVGGI
jgi:putative copper export protein